jgi:beta-glucosidase
VKELVAFERVTLAPGESRTVKLTIAPDAMALWDLRGRRVIEPGKFRVFAGGSSSTVVEGAFEVRK